MLLIGTDEAGYGPNLGPLVVSASIWSAPDVDLSSIRNPLESRKFFIGDSKKLYHSSGSVAPLESVVLAAIQSYATLPKTGTELIRQLERQKGRGGRKGGRDSQTPVWESEHPVEIPSASSRASIFESADFFRKTLAEKNIAFLGFRTRVVSALEFNRQLDRFPSKGAFLSDLTLELVAEILSIQNGTKFPKWDQNEKIVVLCDKHGGRNHYLDVLHHHYPDPFIQVVEEGRGRSVYRFTLSEPSSEHPVEIRFQAKGESEIPIAMASMLSKYLRELEMISFNEFWRSKVPDLKPTAGYPEDAKRFIEEIKAAQIQSEIDDETLWRKK